MTHSTIIFDLDGTLVDTAPDLIDTLNQLFLRERLDPVPFAEARTLIGGGVRKLIERGLSLQGREYNPEVVDPLYAAYLADYAEHLADRSRPFPGLDRALDELAALGFRMAVCTNKLEWLSVRLLDALDLSPRFAAICGQDTFGVQKPDPRILIETLRAAGGTPSAAVMVGDSETDIATARAAGVPFVAVDFGYSEKPISTLAPDRLISHFSGLPAAVLDLLQTGAGDRASPLPA
jgi:phosphoglycolate phosphatase